MVAPIRYLSRRIQEQKIGILQNTEEEKVLEVVGRVGIGTTIFDAEYNLDVRGTANVSGILSVSQIISGAGNTFSDLIVTGDTDLQSDVIIGGGLTVTGVSTFQSAALFADGTEAEPSISFINDTDLGLYRPADNEIAFTNGGSENLRITSAGDVGINSTAPIATLDVNGTLNVSGFSTFRDRVNIISSNVYFTEGFNILTTLGNTMVNLGASSVGIFNRDFRVFNYDLYVENSFNNDRPFFVDNSGSSDPSKVGINSSTPRSELDVRGNVTVSGVSTFQSNVHLLDSVELRLGTGNDLKIYHNSNNSFVSNVGTGNLYISGDDVIIASSAFENKAKFLTDGAVELYYDNSKKFETTGVGVSIVNGASTSATIAGPDEIIIDPATVGDNTGTVRIKGDLYVDGTNFIVDSETITLADFIVGIASTATTDSLADGAGIQIGPDNTFLYEYNGGTNPSLKSSENLNVVSGKVYQIAETERLSADTLSLGTGTTIHSPASNELTFGTNSEERVRIDSSGNVGIGTTNPSQTLDVNGNARFRGAIYDNNNVVGAANSILISTGSGVVWSDITSIPVGDAQTLDGLDSTQFLRSDVDDTKTGITTFSDDAYFGGQIYINETTLVGSATSSLTTVASTPIYTGLSTTIYRSVEYTIQATEGTNFHSTKILALHDGTTAYHSEYGTIFNNSSVATFDVDVSSGNIRLVAVGATSDQTDYVINFTATKL